MLSFLDNWVSYHDTSLPKFSALTYLFFAILLSSFAIAFDLGKLLGLSGRTNVAEFEISDVAVFGPESLGAELALLFAEDGVSVFLLQGEEGVKELMDRATKRRCAAHLMTFGDHQSLFKTLPKPRCVFLSTLHGTAGDETFESMFSHLAHNDIVFDCQRDTEPKEDRARSFKDTGVRYIRCTIVNDQSQAALVGSKSSGSVPREVVSLLERVAANNRDGKPSVDISEDSKGTYQAEIVLRN